MPSGPRTHKKTARKFSSCHARRKILLQAGSFLVSLKMEDEIYDGGSQEMEV